MGAEILYNVFMAVRCIAGHYRSSSLCRCQGPSPLAELPVRVPVPCFRPPERRADDVSLVRVQNGTASL